MATHHRRNTGKALTLEDYSGMANCHAGPQNLCFAEFFAVCVSRGVFDGGLE
jgi:hypothetical protein